MAKLTPKQELFVQEYMVDLNATAAALRAGYKHPDIGRQLLTKPHVQDAVEDSKRARSERVGMAADDVLREIKILGRSSVWDYRIDDEGRVTLAEGAPPDCIRAVSSIKRKVRHLGEGKVEYETEIRLWDKNSALEKAGKHLGMFKDRVEVAGDPSAPVRHEHAHEHALAPAALSAFAADLAAAGLGDLPRDGDAQPAHPPAAAP